ncbi:Exocyst complex component SEC3A [Platanthera guangdongensis]|uniref:Exocyst complex component SEC3A n=1 Tax=Platanthera guangdongensis TaxID=2320717 RepID=A0ABR2LLD7_9ASPA
MMARSSADDAELKRACEVAIEGSKHNVILSIRVAKSRGIFGKSAKLGRQMAKARVLAITTKVKGQKTKTFLRVLKYSNGGILEPAKIYKLKHLSKVEVIQYDPSGSTFMLGFDNLRSQSVSPPQWTMRNKDDRNRLFLCILNMSKEVLGRLPKVVGIDIVEMAIWAKQGVATIKHRTEDPVDGLKKQWPEEAATWRLTCDLRTCSQRSGGLEKNSRSGEEPSSYEELAAWSDATERERNHRGKENCCCREALHD